MKTSELAGIFLDYAVAKCEGIDKETFCLYYEPTEPTDYDSKGYPEFHYSTNWLQGGPIIERERLQLTTSGLWVCSTPIPIVVDGCRRYVFQCGPTPLIAAMRCLVASKLGDEIKIPKCIKEY